MAIEQKFLFESGSVILQDSSLFSPLKEANERWTVMSPAPYQLGGCMATILYELPDDDYVVVEYSFCHEEPRGNGGATVWASSEAPREQRVDSKQAAYFLIQNQFSLTEELSRAWNQPIEKPEPRPLEYWLEHNPIDRTSYIAFEEADPVAQAEQIRNLTIEFIQSRRTNNPNTSRLCRILRSSLFRHFRVDNARWVELYQGLPPNSIDLLDLDWPERADPIRDVLTKLREPLRIPFAVLEATNFSLNSRIRPTAEEQKLAEKELDDAMPEVEGFIQELIQAIACFRQPSIEPGSDDSDEPKYVFQQDENNDWTVRYRGVEETIPDKKGMRHIRALLMHPDNRFDVIKLDNLVNFQPERHATSAGKNLDPDAVADLQRRKNELEDDLEIATTTGNLEAAARIEEEVDEIEDRLSQGKGFAGRDRVDRDDGEKVRSKVTNAISRSIGHIKGFLPQLAAHLKDKIETGREVYYINDLKITWDV